MTATHLLLHRYRTGDGPQPGTPEHDDEMHRWAELDERFRSEGVIVGSFALQDLGSLVVSGSASRWQPEGEIVFAAHAIRAADNAAAAAIASKMPTAGYGVVEVRPLMDID